MQSTATTDGLAVPANVVLVCHTITILQNHLFRVLLFKTCNSYVIVND